MFTWRISEICWRSLILRNPQLEDGGQWEKNCMSHLSGQFLLISNLQHNTGHQSVFDSPPYMLQGPITSIFPTPESNCPKDIFRCFCRKSPQRCQSPKVKGSKRIKLVWSESREMSITHDLRWSTQFCFCLFPSPLPWVHQSPLSIFLRFYVFISKAEI